ncbi:MAG: hypothetical protein FJ090_00760 [Deltaproteobacteria bacterium]|nr:hypothetical protein [Deltaproteobacteria bacterium]
MLFLVVFACTPETVEETEKEGATLPTTALGTGEGELDPESVDYTYILGDEEQLSDPRDLGFDPDGNLWIANRDDDCTFIVFDAGEENQSYYRQKDFAAEHFMEETSAFAFETAEGQDGDHGYEFGSCGESRNTYNGRRRPDNFMGPVLWSAQIDIFAEENPNGLGSHLDMLHQSPNCVGLAWERNNVYWVFDGLAGNVVRYDFQDDHDVGQDDHSDGLVYRLSEPTVTRVEEAPGHMMIDPATGILYVADTGGGRVLALDTQSGERGKELRARNEPLEDYAEWDGVEWQELVTGLSEPGGLALGNGVLYVAEWGTGIIRAFDLGGNRVQALDTGAGAGAIYGIEIGPDGALWVVDNAAPGVFRVDPI